MKNKTYENYLSENKIDTIEQLHLLAPVMDADIPGDPVETMGTFSLDHTKLANTAPQAGVAHVYCSQDDFVVPYEHALKFKAALPEATLHTYEDKNHFLVEEFSPKKKFFGFANLLSGSLDMLIYKIDERSLFKRFGL